MSRGIDLFEVNTSRERTILPVTSNLLQKVTRMGHRMKGEFFFHSYGVCLTGTFNYTLVPTYLSSTITFTRSYLRPAEVIFGQLVIGPSTTHRVDKYSGVYRIYCASYIVWIFSHAIYNGTRAYMCATLLVVSLFSRVLILSCLSLLPTNLVLFILFFFSLPYITSFFFL